MDIKALECPKLRGQLTVYAKKLTRGWWQREDRDEAIQDLIAATYLRAIEQWDRYDPGRGGLLRWMAHFCMRSEMRQWGRALKKRYILTNGIKAKGCVVSPPNAETALLLKEVLRLNKGATGSKTGAALLVARAQGHSCSELARRYKRSATRIQQLVNHQRDALRSQIGELA